MARRRGGGDQRSPGFWRSRRSGKRPSDEADGSTEVTDEAGEDEDRPDAPSDAEDVGADDESDGPTTCDWELHYWTGADWEVLRAAPFPARKCCIYKVRVETKVTRHEQTVYVGHEVSADRRCVPDLDFDWRAMDLDVATSTISGPGDQLDLVPAGRDPIELGGTSGQATDGTDDDRTDDKGTDDNETVWPQTQGEPPDVAARVAHDETTRIEVVLESGCTQPRNTFSSSGDSSLSVLASHECTNGEPGPACPVDLGAHGWQWGEVWGALDWIVHDTRGIDGDELARLIAARRALDPEQRSVTPARAALHRTWDQHDHGSGEPGMIEGGDYDSGRDFRRGERWTTWVASEVEIDAAQLVPQSVWPTTEKVSSGIEQHLTHTIRLAAEMKKGDCASSGCCTGNPGHVCDCDPEFELKLDSTGSHIVVDGSTFAIERVPARADRNIPPVVTAPPSYEAWRLV